MADQEKIKILYIDDEMNNLVGFKATFRMQYNVLVANSADEGKRLVEQHPDLKIIFCDQRMPEKTGVQFFEEITPINPLPIRMLLTGYVDIESVIESINKGHIYRYLNKPWQENDVRSAIEEGYKYYMTSSALNAKNIELQKANEELDKFAYSVTHDIRGPIVSMMGALDILKELDDVAEMKKVVAMMKQAAEKANEFIENVHAYYSLKRGDLQIEEINLNDLVKDVIALQQIQINHSGVKIELGIEQTEIFRSDKTVLQLIINNLLSNAIKYQRMNEENKFVKISGAVQKGKIELRVEDNGIGIENQYLNEIFNMFFRATNTGQGAGFGLYNVKDAIHKLGGNISVQSEINKGSIFTINIPSK
jgi:signal transduction histidine kinase